MTGMHCRHSGTRTTSCLAASALGLFAFGLAVAAQNTANTAVVGDSAQFAAALADSSVGAMLLNGSFAIDASVAASTSSFLERNLSIDSSGTQAVVLDFNRVAFAIVVSNTSTLTVGNVILRGLAPQIAGYPHKNVSGGIIYGPQVPSLPVWPSISGQPNATVDFAETSLYYYPSTQGFNNCSEFQSEVQNQLSTTLPGGSNIVFENFTSLQLMGSTESQLQVFDGSTHIGNMSILITNATVVCDDGTANPQLRKAPPGHQFPWWAGLIIGIAFATAVTLALGAFFLRRSRQQQRRTGPLGPAKNMSSSEGTGTPGSLDTNSLQKGYISSAGSGPPTDEIQQQLREHHLRLLRMRESADLEGIEVGPELGRGSYGRVYKGRWQGALVAIKIVERALGDVDQEDENAREALVAASVSHPNVVACYKICNVRVNAPRQNGEAAQQPASLRNSSNTSKQGLLSPHVEEVTKSMDLEPNAHEKGAFETWLLLEYADRGALDKAVSAGRFRRKSDGTPELASIMRSLLDVATGLQYLHGLGIVHGDLKAANVLLKSTNTDYRGFICKLADFGLSRVLDMNASHVSTQSFGTVPYMPPELLSQGRMTTKVDVYSFAILMWELITGGVPYSDMAFSQVLPIPRILQTAFIPGSAVLYGVVHQGLRPDPPKGTCPPSYRDLMNQCWAQDADDRPTFAEVCTRLQTLVQEHAAVVSVAAQAVSKAAGKPSVVPSGKSFAFGFGARTKVALDLNRNSAPGIAPLSLQNNRTDSPLGQPTAEHAAAPATAATAGGDAGAQPAKPPQRRAKHGRAVSFGGAAGDRRENKESGAKAAGDVENGWLTRPRAKAGERLPAPGQASFGETTL